METNSPTVLKVVQIIVEKLAVDQNSLSYKASFSNDLGIDSLDVYELFTTVEKEFKINIPDEDAEKLLTVGTLIDYIDDKLTYHAKRHQAEVFTMHNPKEDTPAKIFLHLQNFE